MPRPEQVLGVVIHCSAGYGDVESIKIFWKSLGWKSPGYHRVVDEDGKINHLRNYEGYTNGVLGYNSSYIHISYIGGVEKDNYKIAKDSRTQEQKLSLQHLISDVMLWLRANGQGFAILKHENYESEMTLISKIPDSWYNNLEI